MAACQRIDGCACGVAAKSLLRLTGFPRHFHLSVLEHVGFDYVCLGEGEDTLLELVQCLESSSPTDSIRNIQVTGSTRRRCGLLESLGDLPFLSRELLHEQYGVVHISTQRAAVPCRCACWLATLRVPRSGRGGQ